MNPPLFQLDQGSNLIVGAVEGSDFWRNTSYGFVHNSGHCLLRNFPEGSAIELSWLLNYSEQFDQAGLIAWSDEENWIKAGVEVADGLPQLGAVVTYGNSDWSVAPVEEWIGKEVHLRFSRFGDALTIRAKAEPDSWKLVRLAFLDPKKSWQVGLHLAAPTRSGLEVTFTGIKIGDADPSLH